VTALAVRDVLDEIAGNAAALDQQPAFPHQAFVALGQAGALTPPPTREAEWRLVRDIAKADGSVGRIFEGHLNAYERLTLDGIDPGDHLLGVWGADPLPQEGVAAHIDGDTLNGEKVFCSGAGGLDRALVIAQGELVYVDLDAVEIDRTWYRAGGMRASESHRVIFDATPILARLSPLTRQPYLGRDATRTAACWAGILDAAVEAALEDLAGKPELDDIRALSAGRIVTAQQTIDRWFEYAADHDGASTQLRQAIADAGRTILDEASRATGSRPFATGTRLDRARRDFELFVLQHRLDPLVARLGQEQVALARTKGPRVGSARP
jgi:alkylation response protein AidB-like acyl-CoA dehydrogenase